jgi:membrane fusion protein (multidrug efflux system)
MFRGTVESIDTRVDPVSRSVSVRAIVPNLDGTLLPGMLMTIGLESNMRTSLAVPEQALVPIELKQFVFVVPDSMKAERREVRIGAREPGIVEILDGLKAGEKVVVDGTLRVKPGGKVKLAKPEGERPERGKNSKEKRGDQGPKA